MPQRVSNEIKWRNSAARKVLLGDIENSIIPLFESELSAEDAWARVYKHLVEFEKVPFEQFKRQLHAHRDQVQRRLRKANDDEVRYRNYRAVSPEPETFRGSATHMLLRQDVADEMHQGSYRAPSNEFRMRREEYQAMSVREFGQRLRQERRYRKYCNYLESRREEDIYAEPKTEDVYAESDSVDERVPMEEDEAEDEWVPDFFGRDDDMDVDEANRQSKRRRIR